MSRIGKEPVPIPSGVDVKLVDGVVTVNGPRGELSERVPQGINVDIGDDEIVVTRVSDHRDHRALHGLTRSLIANMVTGVTDGYSKSLEIVGVGYRAQARGANALTIQAGYSHPVDVQAPEGVTFEVPTPTRITVSGANKQVVGQVAANIRAIRKPEPYKGKGIRYAGEQVRRKAGKAAGI
jgi:large subunit ribosomal protein L6